MNSGGDNTPDFTLRRSFMARAHHERAVVPPGDNVIWLWQKRTIDDGNVTVKDTARCPLITRNPHHVGTGGVLDEAVVEINTAQVGIGGGVWKTAVRADSVGIFIIHIQLPLLGIGGG